LVAHARRQQEAAAISELGFQLARDAEENVTLVTPMIGLVARRVLDQPHPDVSELPGAPSCHAGFTHVLDRGDLLPVGDSKRDVAQVQECRLGMGRSISPANWVLTASRSSRACQAGTG